MKNSDNKKNVTRSLIGFTKIVLVSLVTALAVVGIAALAIGIREKANAKKWESVTEIEYSISNEGLELYADGKKVKLPSLKVLDGTSSYAKLFDGTYFCLSKEEKSCYYICEDFVNVYEKTEEKHQEEGRNWKVTQKYKIVGRYKTYQLIEFIP